MASPRLRIDDTALLVLDVQEKLVPAIADRERLIGNCTIMLELAAELAIPYLVTEHYPKGIGPIVPALRALASADAMLEKIHFDAVSEPDCARRFAALGRRQAVVAGTEAHVCVLQSALGLKRAGYDPLSRL